MSAFTPEQQRELEQLMAQRYDILSAFRDLDRPQRELLAAEIEPFFYSRQEALRKPKNVYTPRWTLGNSSTATGDINTDSSGVQKGHAGPTLPRWIDIVSGRAWLDSTDPQMLHIQPSGAGADCMFTKIVSSCWATEVAAGRGTEGQSMTSLSGCTFKIYSEPVAAAAAHSTDAQDDVIFICPGTYAITAVLNIPAVSGKSCHIIGAGMNLVTIIPTSGATTNAVNIANQGGGVNITTLISNLTIDCQNVTNSGSGRHCITATTGNPFIMLDRVRFQSSGGDNGIRLGTSTNWELSQCVFYNLSTGCTNSGAVWNASFEQCYWHNTVTTAISATSTRRAMFNGCRFDSGTGISSSTLGDGEWVVTTNIFNCGTVAFKMQGTGDFATVTGNYFDQCGIGVDLSVLAGGGSTRRTIVVSSNIFKAGTTGIKVGTELQYSVLIGNAFNGYTSGNEISGTAGTGTIAVHNVSDAGALTDIGSPVGHAGSGSGGAAPNSEPFVTIGNTANLSAERALALTPADGAHTFTDGGADGSVTLVGVDASASQKGHATLHGHALNFLIDGTVTNQTTLQRVPNACTVASVHIKTADNITVGATSAIVDINKILAANVNTDGVGTTIYTTQANRPTISNGNMGNQATAPDVTAFADGDYMAIQCDQVGTNVTMLAVSVEVTTP